MVDQISSTSSSTSLQRSQNAASTTSLRNNPVVLNSIVQTQQKKAGATNLVTALAVPQTSKTSGSSSNVKLPRGSLVDVLA